MTTETSLNQIVKGAPPPDIKVPPIQPLPPLAKASSEVIEAISARSEKPTTPVHQQHPQQYNVPSSFATQRPPPTIIQTTHSSATPAHDHNLPSAPPQIYLNLLILEASLRAQYLSLLARRCLNTFFLLFLLLWNFTFTYFLFLRPREDGTGKLGGSPYWVIEALIRLGFIAGVVTALLVKATGQWESGVRWPRRWLAVTNRGLRGFNLRVVIVKRGLWKQCISYLRALAPIGGVADGSGDWHLVESPYFPGAGEEHSLGHKPGAVIIEEDLSPSGDHLLLLLLPKNFSSEFRENWEVYRSEYWDRENERRAGLRKKVAIHRRNKAKEAGGWQWWTGFWRLVPHASSKKKHGGDLEKHPHGHHHATHHRSDSRAGHSRNSTISEKEALAKSNRRRSLMRSDSAHSRQSSRSSTPHLLMDGSFDINNDGSKSDRIRRGSSVSSTASARRSLRSGTTSMRRPESGMLSPLTMGSAVTDEPGELGGEKKERKKRRSRPGTPTVSSSESVTIDNVTIKKEEEETLV